MYVYDVHTTLLDLCTVGLWQLSLPPLLCVSLNLVLLLMELDMTLFSLTGAVLFAARILFVSA